MGLFWRVIAVLVACMLPVPALADPLPRSLLILDQSDVRGPFYYEIFSALRSTVNGSAAAPVTIYAESLNLIRFPSAVYEESLTRHLQVKYQGRQIGVIVAIGVATLEYVLRWRTTLWPGIPVVFSLVDEDSFARLRLPPDVTGSIMKFPLADMMKAARAVVPDLRAVAFVGDSWESQTTYRHWKNEIPIETAGLEVIDLTGMTMRAVRQRVAVLPEHTAILYSSMISDGEGALYTPSDALKLVAETSNRPIVISAETYLGYGGIGGFLMTPSLIGRSAAKLAMRILDGENPTSIPAAAGEMVRPIFDWRQMQRWGISEASLPPGSEIRFREPTAWDRYRPQILAIVAIMLLQAAIIIALFHERRKRHRAEVEARDRMSELAHMNRRSTVGEMSASLAHELNQPLGAILAHTETAEMVVNSPSPDMDLIKEIVADIKRADMRAAEIIQRLRSILKKAPYETMDFDLNEVVREVFDFLAVQAGERGVVLSNVPAEQTLQVHGDRIQIQQVILNLIVNGMEAMADALGAQRKIIGRTAQLDDGFAEISISDSGPGISPDNLRKIFDPFFTTKTEGMGMGLSIVRTIAEAHGGRIWAENHTAGGAVFRLVLPLANVVQQSA
jgi:signal transduction histidine kinase